MLKKFVKFLLAKKNKAIVDSPAMHFLRHFDVSCIIDVGANTGQYASDLRRKGYKGRIESFEPMLSAYKSLQKLSSSDNNWNVHHVGLGEKSETLQLNISKNGPSSSILELNADLDHGGLSLEFIDKEKINVTTLDSFASRYLENVERPFVKIDTQGFERQVVNGAYSFLKRSVGLQLELSLLPIYENESLIEEMISLVRGLGFVPYWISHGYSHRVTKQLLQVDVMFFRS